MQDNGFMKTTNTEQIRHTVYADPVVTKSNPKYEVKKPGPVRVNFIFMHASIM